MTDHDRPLDTELTDERLARITARVHAGIAASSPRPSRSLTLLRAAIVLLVVATAAFAGWAYDTNRGGSPDGPASSPTTPGPEGPEPVDLAAVAAEQPYVPIGDGYAHLVREKIEYGTSVLLKWWVAADGTGRQVFNAGLPSATDQTFDDPDHLKIGTLTPAQVSTPGATPASMYDALLAAGNYPYDDPKATMGADIVPLLAWPGVLPSTRAALFRLLTDSGYEAKPSTDPDVTVLVGSGARQTVYFNNKPTLYSTLITATFDNRTSELIRYRIQIPEVSTSDTTLEYPERGVTATPY